MFVKAKDQVVVISGKDKGVKGKVVSAAPKTGRIAVEGVAMVTKHQKSRQQGQPGGIIKKDAFIDASNVMLHPRGPQGCGSHRQGWQSQQEERPRLQEVRRRNLIRRSQDNGYPY